jgi:pimeloyl-ACP methyl ester carboxylesterase
MLSQRGWPVWVFLHGAGGNGDFWELVRPYFPTNCRLIDLPGHAGGRPPRSGSSTTAPGPALAGIADYAQWLTAQVAAWGDKEVILVGHSMGGAIAQEVALARPPWLCGVILSSTAARLPPAPELLALLEDDFPAAVDWLIAHAFAGEAGHYRREGVRRHLLRLGPEVVRGDYQACAEFDVSRRVEAGELRGPAVVVWGAADGITPPAESARLAAHIQGARTAAVARAAHMAPLEQPEAWSGAVLRLWGEALRAARQAG